MKKPSGREGLKKGVVNTIQFQPSGGAGLELLLKLILFTKKNMIALIFNKYMVLLVYCQCLNHFFTKKI